MKTWAELNRSGAALRSENARRVALAAGVLRPVQGASEARGVDGELARWEALRAQFAGTLRLPWDLESAAVMKAVAAHRAYWRPPTVRLLVLSESHVMTREAELEAPVPLAVFGHAAAPPAFVRMVYCLGYGERDLVQGRVHPNWGTPQFWKLLAAGIDESLCPQVVERTTPDLMQRLAAKLAVLEALKARGVWLLDACPVALYAASQPKPRMALLAQAMEIAWAATTREAIREAAPRAVMIVGKMVHDGIGGRIRAMLGPNVPVQWMYQPPRCSADGAGAVDVSAAGAAAGGGARGRARAIAGDGQRHGGVMRRRGAPGNRREAAIARASGPSRLQRIVRKCIPNFLIRLFPTVEPLVVKSDWRTVRMTPRPIFQDTGSVNPIWLPKKPSHFRFGHTLPERAPVCFIFAG